MLREGVEKMKEQQEEVQFNIAVNPDIKKEIERIAFEKDAKVKVIVADAFKNYLWMHGIKI